MFRTTVCLLSHLLLYNRESFWVYVVCFHTESLHSPCYLYLSPPPFLSVARHLAHLHLSLDSRFFFLLLYPVSTTLPLAPPFLPTTLLPMYLHYMLFFLFHTLITPPYDIYPEPLFPSNSIPQMFYFSLLHIHKLVRFTF